MTVLLDRIDLPERIFPFPFSIADTDRVIKRPKQSLYLWDFKRLNFLFPFCPAAFCLAAGVDERVDLEQPLTDSIGEQRAYDSIELTDG